MWMAMLFPGMLLVIPYAVAQARIVARVEVATRRPLPTVAYLAVCVVGFVIPALLALVLQPRLNQAARMDVEELRRMRIC
jgi:formate-dependent nitrite reductase membrane component NrfD